MPVTQPIAANARFRTAAVPAALPGETPAVPTLFSHLLQLDQGAAEVFWVQEQNRLVMGAEFRLAVAEHAGTGGGQTVTGGKDIVNLVADMVHAAGRVLVEKAAHRRIGPKRVQQLDLAVRQFD